MSTSYSRAVNACSAACRRTGRRTSPRFRKRAFTALRITGTGVLHIEAKLTALGPRIVEINARMGGGPIHRIVEAVWGVDLVEAQLRSSLGLTQNLGLSGRPRCAVADAFVYPETSGRLVENPVPAAAARRDDVLALDPYAEIGAEVAGLDEVFATAVAQVAVQGPDLRQARAGLAELLREPVTTEPLDARVPTA
jgi:hypothetical protein